MHFYAIFRWQCHLLFAVFEIKGNIPGYPLVLESQFERCKFKALKVLENEGSPWKLISPWKWFFCFWKIFIDWKSYWTFRHVTVNSGNNVTLEGLFVKKYSGWNILLLKVWVMILLQCKNDCMLTAVYWMWNIFWNVHGCRRKVLESPWKCPWKSLNYEVTEEGLPCIHLLPEQLLTET